MLQLEKSIEKNQDIVNSSSINTSNEYKLFGEQYLENPVYNGKVNSKLTVSVCTWRGIPTVDDF